MKRRKTFNEDWVASTTLRRCIILSGSAIACAVSQGSILLRCIEYVITPSSSSLSEIAAERFE